MTGDAGAVFAVALSMLVGAVAFWVGRFNGYDEGFKDGKRTGYLQGVVHGHGIGYKDCMSRRHLVKKDA